ncbi:MAG: alpha/beta hydrolase [Rikenellaceae bacterium]
MKSYIINITFYIAQFAIVTSLLLFSFCSNAASTSDSEEQVEEQTEAVATLTSYKVYYKDVDELRLDMNVMHLNDIEDDEQRVAMILIHGGGWCNGDNTAMEDHAKYFASHGIVLFLINYRTTDMISDSTPKKSLQDAKSAVRYVRANADRFNIDPDKIIVGGGSVGGHMAAAVSMTPNINESTDDLSISTDACASILFNPVVCNGPETEGAYTGYNYSWVKDYYLDFSPMYNVREGVPPSIFMVGDQDHLIPTEVAYEYQRLIEEVGGRCDLHIYEDQPHSFYFISGQDASNFYYAMTAAHEFLQSLGYLDSRANVKAWLSAQDCGYYVK